MSTPCKDDGDEFESEYEELKHIPGWDQLVKPQMCSSYRGAFGKPRCLSLHEIFRIRNENDRFLFGESRLGCFPDDLFQYGLFRDGAWYWDFKPLLKRFLVRRFEGDHRLFYAPTRATLLDYFRTSELDSQGVGISDITFSEHDLKPYSNCVR